MLDDRVQSLLIDSSAEDFIPIFACKRISFDALLNMNETDLIKVVWRSVLAFILKIMEESLRNFWNVFQLGVTDMSVRELILKQISAYGNEGPSVPSAPLADAASSNGEDQYPADEAVATEAANQIPGINKLWIEAECVICLDKKVRQSLWIPFI